MVCYEIYDVLTLLHPPLTGIVAMYMYCKSKNTVFVNYLVTTIG